MRLDHIYTGDCLAILPEAIERGSIDLIYADPPYNLSGRKLELRDNTTGGPFRKMNEQWDTFTGQAYLDFTRAWIQACQAVLKENGGMYVSCSYHNIGEIITCARESHLQLNNILTWCKSNAMPNLTRRTFTHATEYICWFVAGRGWVFNYEEIKKLHPHRTKSGAPKQMRDFLDFIELPLVQGRERLHGDDGRALHPTQKPETLLELIITASSRRGDTVLDPFFGTGTTGVVAARLDRHWIGIEKDAGYADAAARRIAAG
ncbi:site-specific DNA-methyltransferase [bacterium]|nr:site-specific DNA-methyltransferase [candidate division CSSED10-310 bacterium]